MTSRLLSDKQRTWLARAIVLSAAAFGLGWRLWPQRAWADLLIANYYLTSLSLGAAVFIAVQYVAGAGWPTVFRRVPEAATAYLPVGALVAAATLLGARFIYPWAIPGAATAKGGYLSLWAISARSIVYWGGWIFFTRKLAALSREQDRTGAVETTEKARVVSAAFLIVFGVTFTLSVVDGLMSLEPRWYSTIYPWFLFAGAFESGLAATILLVSTLRRRGHFAELNDHHVHDLGKYLFAFAVFWAYLWFSQYLLIWYSNIPEETAHYVVRLSDGWAPLFWLNPIVNFAAPFVLLLPASRKKRLKIVFGAAALLLAGHWLDCYLLVAPAVLGPHPRFGWLEPAVLLGPAAAFLLLFDRAFAAAPAVPARDPYLVESLHFEGV